MQQSFHIRGNSLHACTESYEALKLDGRGLLHMWEEPQSHAKYIMGMDPSVGLTGWHRAARTPEDIKTDNGAIEVFRVDGKKRLKRDVKTGEVEIDKRTKQPLYEYMDVQVAEFFAPVDAVEIARVCSFVGQLYKGEAEVDCELIFEAYPGPGILSTQELLRLNYNNLWHWEIVGGQQAEETRSIGWRAMYESNRLLWYRTRRHMLEEKFEIYSHWLHQEWANAQIEVDNSFIKAHWGTGIHDDLVKACSLAFWAGHKWEYNEDRTWEQLPNQDPDMDWQRHAPGLDDDVVSWRDAARMIG